MATVKLLDELIAGLSADNPNLTDALMKTKVLLHKIGRKDLAEWVNQELTGYPNSVPVPEYRVIHAGVHGNAANVAWQFNDQPLPTMHLKPELRKRFEELEMRESISTIEELASNNKGSLIREIPPEAYHLFEKNLVPGTKIQRAWSSIGHGQVAQVLTQVRSRLLDFLLELHEKVGDEMTDDEIKQIGQSAETGTMFNQAIYGNNNTILIGNHNTQTVVRRIEEHDFEALAEILRGKAVAAEDIESLRDALDGDEGTPEVATKQIGPRARDWMKRMLAKAIDTSWGVEVSIAANLLTDALKAYYGWFR
ncbi:MAG: hypothetical protein ACRD3W_22190 [Terriglobales bacterium]